MQIRLVPGGRGQSGDAGSSYVSSPGVNVLNPPSVRAPPPSLEGISDPPRVGEVRGRHDLGRKSGLSPPLDRRDGVQDTGGCVGAYLQEAAGRRSPHPTQPNPTGSAFAGAQPRRADVRGKEGTHRRRRWGRRSPSESGAGMGIGRFNGCDSK